MKPTLVIGYGNPDRQDDGVALLILVRLAHNLGRLVLNQPEESFFPSGLNPDLWFDLQLLPEMAHTVAGYERVCFIDAHTGQVPEEVQITPLAGCYQPSVLTHHMTPATFLSLCQALNNTTPEAILVSVRGNQFGFSRVLSPQTDRLVDQAAKVIETWMQAIS